jgi:hypothetical protein
VKTAHVSLTFYLFHPNFGLNVFEITGALEQGVKMVTMGQIIKKDLGDFGANIPVISLIY